METWQRVAWVPLDRLVRVASMDPRVRIEMVYATPENFTGRVLYASGEAWLRLGTALKLRRAQDRLARRGQFLKVLDAYRPPSAQRALWAACPDPRFVAPPQRGSRHTRGAAVDVTLVDEAGVALEMPSAHDEFSERSGRDWDAASEAARRHRDGLRVAMTEAGFETVSSEWWHFDDAAWRQYPLLDWEFDGEAAGDFSGLPTVGGDR